MNRLEYNKEGFSLIETLIGIMLTALATSSIFLGITESRLSLESIKIKEVAHQELKDYTENLKSMIATGVENFTDSPQGTEVVLKQNKEGETVLTGSLHKNIVKSVNSGDYSIYYHIHTYIVWQDEGQFFFGKTTDSDHLDTLEFKGYQVQFNL